MTQTQDRIEIPTHDGGRMPAFEAAPSSGSGPAIVLLHEIFGVTDYMKRRARDLAALGYLVVVPELFWRLDSNVVVAEDSQEGLQQAFGYLQRLDEAQAVDDVTAALEYLRALPQTSGRAAVLGFCMGGRIAYKVGVAADPDVVVSYYGSGIGALLDNAGELTCPVIFHFGKADTFLPVQEAEQIAAAFARRGNAEAHMHEGAGHAFDNPSPMFHHGDASREAWPQTVAFLRRYYPTTNS